MKKYFLIFITLLCIIVVSCKKSSSSTSCTLSSTSIIGKYKLTAATFAGADAISQIPECDRDNIFELKSGGIATVTDTGTPIVCSPPSDKTGAWSLNGSTLTTSDSTLSGTISDFSCTGFKISTTRTIVGFPGTSIITLTKQ